MSRLLQGIDHIYHAAGSWITSNPSYRGMLGYSWIAISCLSIIVVSSYDLTFRRGRIHHGGDLSTLMSESSIYTADSSTTDIIKDKLGRYIELKSRPSYISIPRNRLELPFAIQMMRSSYATVDDLDFIPMDIFQKVFFLFRQSEWEDYRNYHQYVMQGDLADPLYFDFISFCQYAVISDSMKKGMYDFTERVGAEGDVQRVYRNNSIMNENLPAAHSIRVGNKLMTYLIETYPSEKVLQNLAASSRDRRVYEQAASALLDLMSINAFALQPAFTFLEENVSGSSALYRLSLKAPVNLWSQQILRYRKDAPINDFENKVLLALAKRLGFNYEVLSTSIANRIDVSHIIKLT
jgi:hypothetical protein